MDSQLNVVPQMWQVQVRSPVALAVDWGVLVPQWAVEMLLLLLVVLGVLHPHRAAMGEVKLTDRAGVDGGS